jgi:AraC-like DNA-binding protein
MDVLSEVLRAVRLTGAVFFDIHAAAPWAVASPRTDEIRTRVMPTSDHLMSFHLVMDGEGWIEANELGEIPRRIERGDVILMPRGDSHYLSSAPGVRVPARMEDFYRPQDRQLPFRVSVDGNGPGIHIVCGYFGCDAAPFNPLLDVLPRLTVIKAGPDCGKLAATFINAALTEGGAERPGGETILAKLSELMLVQAIRMHIEALPAESGGWLGGLRDPLVGRVLGQIHADPARDWSLVSLARAAGLSRSVMAERFTRLVGLPPMTYLARWRMQLAAHALERPGAAIANVAADVGYQSEAAFNRAFKKIVGSPPGLWRRSRQDAA